MGASALIVATWVAADGTLDDLRRFAESRGESILPDCNDNTFVSNGKIYIYDAAGRRWPKTQKLCQLELEINWQLRPSEGTRRRINMPKKGHTEEQSD